MTEIEYTYTRRTKGFGLTLTDQEYNILRNMAEAKEVSMGYLVRQCLRRHLLKLPIDGI